MKIIKPWPSLFDMTLTPHNAMKKGYQYMDDVIYDQKNPSDAMADILELAKELDGKLGTPGNPIYPDPYYGLYIPLEVNKKLKKY